MSDAAVSLDGRRLRPQRNRRAVVDAILELLDEGVVDPGAAEVADRAGVSVRSVFRYFDDLDALAVAAVERQIERTGHLYAPPPRDGSRADRVDALVVQRARLFEAIAPARRHALRRSTGQQAIRAGLDRAGRVLRRQVADQFAVELALAPGSERGVALDALEAAAGWSTWEHLRTDLGRTETRAAAVVRRTLQALLDDLGPDDPPAATSTPRPRSNHGPAAHPR